MLSLEDQLYLNNLGYGITVEDIGVDMQTDNVYTQQYPTLHPTYNQNTNSKNTSPTNNDIDKTRENSPIGDISGYIPIQDKFQMEDYYSGEEDAVLYHAANNKPTPIASSTNDTVDLTKNQPEETYDSGNINSDSLLSFVSDSSTPLKTDVRPQKYAKGKINESKFQHIIPEQVDLIPWGIDRDKVHHVKCQEKDYIE